MQKERKAFVKYFTFEEKSLFSAKTYLRYVYKFIVLFYKTEKESIVPERYDTLFFAWEFYVL